LHVWDFGGQHIYQSTHQFFLTERSLYVLVWNARVDVEQAALDRWLKNIQILAPQSPVLLVATHSDERAADVVRKSDELERSYYLGNVEMAAAWIELRQWVRVRRRLDEATASRRGWEWWWLRARSGVSSVELKLASDVRSLQFNPAGTRIVSGSNDGTARVWDAATGASLAELRGHTGWVNSAAFSPDGTQIVTASDDNTARLWDAVNGTSRATLVHMNATRGSSGRILFTDRPEFDLVTRSILAKPTMSTA
jgi:hypothetical protein